MATKPTITVGVIGTGWIVRAHVYGIQTLNLLNPHPARIRVKWLYGRKETSASAMASELGAEQWTTSWEQVVDDPEVDVIANVSTNSLHHPVTLAALTAGKHILCEKPLATTVAEAAEMVQAAERAGVLAAAGFNYRYVPAVRLIRNLVDSGELGEIRHYRGLYLQDWQSNNPGWSGALGGSAVLDFSHVFDLMRHLGGEPRSVSAVATTFLGKADDAFIAAFELGGPSVGSIEASSCATGWKGRNRVEVNGTLGSAWWDMEDFSRVHVMLTKDQSGGLGGFREIVVSEAEHPFMDQWWTAGHVVGWQSTFVHEWRAFLTSVARGEPLEPLQATFADGLRAGQLGAATLRSAAEGVRVACAPGAPG